MPELPLATLRSRFGARLQENVPLAHYTTARVGGPADALLPVNSAEELARTIEQVWELGVPYLILGGGSNVLVSDRGVRELVILNRTRNIRIDSKHQPPTAWAESGANLGALARQTALRGFSGLEWASTIPGTTGGAVYGNAGAHGGDMAGSLLLAEILHPQLGRNWWPVEQMGYQYRSSTLKSDPGRAVILSAKLKLTPSTPEAVQAKIENLSAERRSTQPPGASMGSMFKNPSGDHAGRLIDSAGLKGRSLGGAEISSIHANFFVNRGAASAEDILGLIHLAQESVAEKTGILLELEIELIGEWNSTRGH
ncbi:MAG TPA: UDP-N-acetylmuramate dehydrogenase [Anaerolineaceae bacterium]